MSWDRENPDLGQGRDTFEENQAEIGEFLQSARSLSERILERSRRRAEQIVRDAEERAAVILDDAHSRADEILTRAQEQADEIVRSARPQQTNEAAVLQDYAVSFVSESLDKLRQQHLDAIDLINAQWQAFLCGLPGSETGEEKDEEPPSDLEDRVSAIYREMEELFWDEEEHNGERS